MLISPSAKNNLFFLYAASQQKCCSHKPSNVLGRFHTASHLQFEAETSTGQTIQKQVDAVVDVHQQEAGGL